MPIYFLEHVSFPVGHPVQEVGGSRDGGGDEEGGQAGHHWSQ